MIHSADALSLVTLSTEELTAIASIEAMIDNAISREYAAGYSAGAPLQLPVPLTVTPKIAYAVARQYTVHGHWRVNVASVDPLLFQFAPSIDPVASTSPGAGRTLPPVMCMESPASGPGQKRLLVRMPTRSRPVQALEVLAKYRAMAGAPVAIEVVIDEDDASMLNAPVLRRLHALGCVVTVGNHKSKVQACNAGRVDEWDILLLASDDMVPVVDGYAARVLDLFEQHWPHLDGAIYQDDGFQHANLCTLPIIGRRFYEQFGYVYHPEYQSLFCDTEQQRLWSAMGRLVYVDEALIEHRHHVAQKSQNDALYLRNDALWDADQATFNGREARRRVGAQWGFGAPTLLLSICIATMPKRRAMLDRLVAEIYRQRDDVRPLNSDFRRCVEVVVDAEDGTIGEKRQRLLERSNGRFVAFVDDDDMISHDYVWRIVGALQDSPTVDCVAINGLMTTAGSRGERFVHALGYEWGERDGVHYRSPNHLSPVRRDLALAAGFPAQNHGEDHAYSVKLQPLLKNQATIGSDPVYYYFFTPEKDERTVAP